MIKNNLTNQAIVAGEVVSPFSFSHTVCGENFYITHLSVGRLSGQADIIPIMVSDRLIDVTKDFSGSKATIDGQWRSYNRCIGEKMRLQLFLLAFSLDFFEDEETKNSIILVGHICKIPVYRATPLGREIADVLLAVNRPYGKSDYIPCVCWGRNAKFASTLVVGTKIKVIGRIQSREYQKKISDERFETRVAHEVSASRLEVIKDED